MKLNQASYNHLMTMLESKDSELITVAKNMIINNLETKEDPETAYWANKLVMHFMNNSRFEELFMHKSSSLLKAWEKSKIE